MKLITSTLLMVLIGYYAAVACADTSKKPCAAIAENETAYITDWISLYQSYEQYSHCDDGAVAEGYVESIVRLLTHKWDRITDLKQLIRNDKNFERFILRHIGEMVSEKDSTLIKKNVRRRCPAGLANFCKKVDKALSD